MSNNKIGQYSFKDQEQLLKPKPQYHQNRPSSTKSQPQFPKQLLIILAFSFFMCKLSSFFPKNYSIFGWFIHAADTIIAFAIALTASSSAQSSNLTITYSLMFAYGIYKAIVVLSNNVTLTQKDFQNESLLAGNFVLQLHSACLYFISYFKFINVEIFYVPDLMFVCVAIGLFVLGFTLQLIAGNNLFLVLRDLITNQQIWLMCTYTFAAYFFHSYLTKWSNSEKQFKNSMKILACKISLVLIIVFVNPIFQAHSYVMVIIVLPAFIGTGPHNSVFYLQTRHYQVFVSILVCYSVHSLNGWLTNEANTYTSIIDTLNFHFTVCIALVLLYWLMALEEVTLSLSPSAFMQSLAPLFCINTLSQKTKTKKDSLYFSSIILLKLSLSFLIICQCFLCLSIYCYTYHHDNLNIHEINIDNWSQAVTTQNIPEIEEGLDVFLVIVLGAFTFAYVSYYSTQFEFQNKRLQKLFGLTICGFLGLCCLSNVNEYFQLDFLVLYPKSYSIQVYKNMYLSLNGCYSSVSIFGFSSDQIIKFIQIAALLLFVSLFTYQKVTNLSPESTVFFFFIYLLGCCIIYFSILYGIFYWECTNCWFWVTIYVLVMCSYVLAFYANPMAINTYFKNRRKAKK